MSRDDAVLVYSTDPERNKKCPRCKYLLPECRCNSNQKDLSKHQDRVTAVLRIEKSGRKGKTVTVIDRLPKQELYLKDLAKKIKVRCGTGGTHRLEQQYGVVEIQGDQREMIRTVLKAEGIEYKG